MSAAESSGFENPDHDVPLSTKYLLQATALQFWALCRILYYWSEAINLWMKVLILQSTYAQEAVTFLETD